MVYVPEYAAEEVLVKPHDKYKEIRDISKIISIRSGYELKEKWYKDPEIYIFSVPVGQEDRACLQFQEDKEFVEWAERRDLKQERIWDSLDEVLGSLENARDSPEDCEQIKKARDYLNDLIEREF